MGKMKEISLYCEDEDLQGLTEYLESYDKFKDNAMGIAANFIIAHKKMRDRSEEEAYKVLNQIHDKLQDKSKKVGAEPYPKYDEEKKEYKYPNKEEE